MCMLSNESLLRRIIFTDQINLATRTWPPLLSDPKVMRGI